MTRDELKEQAAAHLRKLGVPPSNFSIAGRKDGVEITMVTANCNRKTLKLLAGEAQVSLAAIKRKITTEYRGGDA